MHAVDVDTLHHNVEPKGKQNIYKNGAYQSPK